MHTTTSPFLHDAERALADARARGGDEAEAVRAYIRRERAHLLTCYDLEALVGMVLAARASGSTAPVPLEPYLPA